MKTLTKNVLHQMITYQGRPYFTAQYFHHQYKNVNGGEKYARLDNFNRLIRSIETFPDYVNRGDIVELTYNKDEISNSDLELLYISVSYKPIMLISATAQVALTHHLDDEISKTTSVKVNPKVATIGGLALQNELIFANAAANMLRVSETSKIRMLTVVAENHNINTKLLPPYTDEMRTRSLTDLLKEHGATRSAFVVGRLLVKAGIYERLSRPSANGRLKKFWVLTSTGLSYGKNETNPNSPQQAQPMFFVHKFDDVLNLLAENSDERIKNTQF